MWWEQNAMNHVELTIKLNLLTNYLIKYFIIFHVTREYFAFSGCAVTRSKWPTRRSWKFPLFPKS